MEKKHDTPSILDMLLDKENTAPIPLFDEIGRQYEFEKVAVIPDDNKLFCILKPITQIEDVADDEAIMFEYTEKGLLSVVEEEAQILKICEKFEELCEKEQRKRS